MIKLLIFDLDRTLIDTLRRFHEVYSEMVGGIEWEEFLNLFKDDRLDELVRGDRREFWEEFTRRFSRFRHPSDGPIPGARDVLMRLSTKYRIVVTTGRRVPPEKVWEELREFGLAEFVDEVRTLVGSDGLWERDGLLKRVLEENGVRPEEAIFVGDYWVDMESARRAGLRAIAVRTGLEPDDRLKEHGADAIIDGIWELERLLKALEGERGKLPDRAETHEG